VVGGINRWVMDCNWKFATENFIGDGYHAGVSHKSATLAGHAVLGLRQQQQQPGRQFANQSTPLSFRFGTKYGSGIGANLRPADTAASAPTGMGEAVESYYQERIANMEKVLGKTRSRLGSFNAMFPNFSINSSADQIHVWNPSGPLHTECWVYILVDKAAPQEVKHAMRLTGQRHFGPSGMFEQDDGDNWKLSTIGAKGTIAQRYPLNYQMGLHDEWFSADGELPDRQQGTNGDTNQLNFHRHWVALMSGKSWADIRNNSFQKVGT